MRDPGAQRLGRVLIAAGSDSGGGAGIQADIKAVTALGGYAMTAITALTAQNTQGVAAVEAVPPAFVALQMTLAIGDIGADAVKIGMLHRAPVVNAVADVLAAEGQGIPLVLDTVMIAKGGAALLENDAVAAIRDRLVPGAALVTPNLPEAAALTGLEVTTPKAMEKAGRAILAMGAKAALIKGGHLEGDHVIDLLVTPERTRAFEAPRIATRHTHGTGCTLASACAAGIAQGMDLEAAVGRAIAYVQEAIRTAPGLGHGHGPLNHGHTVAPFTGGQT